MVQAQCKTKVVLGLIVFRKIDVLFDLPENALGRNQQHDGGYNNEYLSQHLKKLTLYQTRIRPIYFSRANLMKTFMRWKLALRITYRRAMKTL